MLSTHMNSGVSHSPASRIWWINVPSIASSCNPWTSPFWTFPSTASQRPPWCHDGHDAVAKGMALWWGRGFFLGWFDAFFWWVERIEPNKFMLFWWDLTGQNNDLMIHIHTYTYIYIWWWWGYTLWCSNRLAGKSIKKWRFQKGFTIEPKGWFLIAGGDVIFFTGQPLLGGSLHL